MGTITTLVEEKKLIPMTVKLGRGQFFERKLYAFPECRDWMKKEVPNMRTGRVAAASTPMEQLVERLRQWLAGEPMAHGRMFRDMDPKSDHVWELKTPDLRIYGWIYRPREFIAARGGYADDYKEPTKTKNYADEVRAVVKMRDALPLDGGKYATGPFDKLI